MLRAAQRTVSNPLESAGLAGTVDGLCKIHGETIHRKPDLCSKSVADWRGPAFLQC